jgi:hypothetical protein
MKLLVTGGRQRGPIHLRKMREWHLYDEARLVELDTETGEIELRLRYETPGEDCPEERPCHVFKTASVQGDEIAAVTQTEVLLLDRASLEIRERISHRLFNDLHHVVRIDGRLHVVCTGLDRLLILDESGEPVEIRGALPESELRPLDPAVDYRRLATTKPHAAHPNHVFQTEQGIWLTRFEQRDAVCLDDPSLRIPIEIGRPHDGIRHDGALWFTTVNGYLVRWNPGEPDSITRIAIGEMIGAEDPLGWPLGWCRGLLFHGDSAFVGFSRIRYTRTRRNLSWIRHGFRQTAGHVDRPTRILHLDLAKGTVEGEWDLEPWGVNAVFGILPAE